MSPHATAVFCPHSQRLRQITNKCSTSTLHRRSNSCLRCAGHCVARACSRPFTPSLRRQEQTIESMHARLNAVEHRLDSQTRWVGRGAASVLPCTCTHTHQRVLYPRTDWLRLRTEAEDRAAQTAVDLQASQVAKQVSNGEDSVSAALCAC